MKKLLFLFVTLLFAGTVMVSADDKFVLVIDPGHGGRDAGAVRGSYKEKDINLGVALALGRLIESNMNDVKVVYTRKNDKFVDLYKRAEVANKAKANLFVSIHTNSTASRTTTAQGADTYILGLARSEENLAVAKRENSVILLEDNYSKRYEGFDPNSPESYIIFEFMTDKYMEQSLEFAGLVQKGFTNVAKRKDRGVRQAGFLVLRESAMPSVLIELGFINNPSEAKYLSGSTGQRSMASAIYTGIKKYIEDFNKKRGQSTVVAVNNTTKSDEKPFVGKKIEAQPEKKADVSKKETTTVTSRPVVQNTVTETQMAEHAKEERTTSTRPYISKNKDVNELQGTQVVSSGNQVGEIPVAEETEESVPVVSRVDNTTVYETASVETKTETRENRTVSQNENILQNVVEYRVQFLISQRRIPSNSSQFKGLSPVDEYIDGGIYKYTYGSTMDEAEAIKIRNEIRNKFKDAFVVKFRNGTRIK